MIISTTSKKYSSVSLSLAVDVEYQTISYNVQSSIKGIYKNLYFESFNNACKCYKALSEKVKSL